MATQTADASQLARAQAARQTNTGFWSDALWRLRHDTTTMVAFGFLTVLISLAAGADLLAEHFFKTSFTAQDLLNTYAKPSFAAEPKLWMGADNLGRSEIVRLLYGGRVSLFIGVFGSTVALSIGLFVGLTAGYFRGWWDDVVVWVITTIESIPLIYLLILVGVFFRLSPFTLAVFIGSIAWLGSASLSRGQTFALREREFVLAARTIGASHSRIILKHIFPNVIPLMIVIAMLSVGGFILGESALSFLGFGIQPPTPSWGNMLTLATQFYYKGPHLILFPGLAISLTVLCFYLIGDGLRDAFDPRLRGSVGGRRRQ